MEFLCFARDIKVNTQPQACDLYKGYVIPSPTLFFLFFALKGNYE